MTFKAGRIFPGTPHLMADLIELLVLLRIDGRCAYTVSDVASYLREQEDEVEFEPGRRVPEHIERAWVHLEYRQAKFARDYPFQLASESIQNRARLSAGARIYLLKLICSRLASFQKAQQSELASLFVNLSREACRQLMPSWADVRIFDANSEDRRAYYGTDLRKALRKLGADLHANAISEDVCDQQSSSGDLGIDIVATADWPGDGAPGVHAFLGQCAAQGKDWPEKILESVPLRYSAVWTLLHEPLNVCFIPVMYRGPDGRWINTQKATGALLIDRVRFWWLLKKGNAFQRIVREPWFTRFEELLAEIRAGVAANSI